VDFSTEIPWLCASLNCPSVAELDTWTQDELYTYAEEALRAVARKFILFAGYNTATTLTIGQAVYGLPSDHVATIYLAAAGAMLAPSNVAEMEALDDSWTTAANATPARWVGNAADMTVAGIYPPPAAPCPLTLVYQAECPDLSVASPVVAMPTIMGDYLALRVLEQARMRQGDAQMADASKAFGNMADTIESAFQAYWGSK